MRDFTSAKRIVVKVGTSTIAHETGMTNIRSIERLVKVLADLKNEGREIILVSSGAIGIGMGKLKLKKRPTDIPSKQACAAIGQSELMYIYDKLFSEYNHIVSQVLLTGDGVESDRRKQNVKNTFLKLLEMNTVPIVNENDTVSVTEIEIGDNDTLSAIVSEIVGADLLVILSDIDGLYTSDPSKDENAKLIHNVEKIDDYIVSIAGGSESGLGTGGMSTKIHAANITHENNIDMVILNGNDPNNLYKLLDGEDIGTYFKG